ncbi:MAG: aldo/keto reductase [Ruminococcaceae bacterium]|nr:aldo/keto reductase [Oscillospiraceae bacterium]
MSQLEPNIELYNVPAKLTDFHGMPYRQLGKSGLRVSAVGLGTWKYGYPETGDGSRVNEAQAMEIFDRAWELGVTLWDTANRYNAASGNSERLIGKWLKNNPDKRRDIVVASKVWGGMDGRTPNHWGLSRANILDSVHACLERLQTDHMDLLYFHHTDPLIELEESLLAVEDLIREGCVRYFAISNADVKDLCDYEAFYKENRPLRARVCAVQNRFDIIRGEDAAHPGVLDYCANEKVSFIAWGPLGQGLLTGRYNDKTSIGKGDRLFDENNLSALESESIMERLQILSKYADSMGVSVATLTLALMLHISGMGPVIPAASNIKQLEANASAATLSISDEQAAEILNAVK